MLSKFKSLLIGPPLPTQKLGEKKIDNIRALAAFSPDALSSIAYANQEIYMGLVVAGAAGLSLAFPIGLVIVGLLAIVALSYFQTIQTYPSGGGSYVVARDNLGSGVGQLAASGLLIGYLLTAAVSLTAGTEAIISAFPELQPYKIWISLFFLLVITISNLRGLQETGTLMSIPVYLFLFTYLPLLGYGLIRALIVGSAPAVLPASISIQPITPWLILHTFATGCTALTGIEAISNGVPSFRHPETKNAGKTLIVMALLMGVLFIGSIGLTQYLGVVSNQEETILSALARRLLGSGFLYYFVQFSTMLVLGVAANTSFAGFPRLSAILAKDGMLPRQLSGLGDRLVFANGILLLAAGTGLLILLFAGESHALIPLFASGVFLAFTLSQAGMVIHWWRERGPQWILKFLINGLGAIVTSITLIVVVFSKFMEGAWITVMLILILVLMFKSIHSHYQTTARELSMEGLPPSLRPYPKPRIVIPVSGVHRGVIDAIAFARSISDDVTAVYVELEPGNGEKVRNKWKRWWPDIPLMVVPSAYRSIIGPLLEYLDKTDAEHHDGQLATVILPEFIPAKWWQALLHNQTAWLLKTALLYRRRNLGYQRVIIDIPYHLKEKE